MTLAAILQVCLLMASPSAGHSFLPALPLAQSTVPQQEPSPGSPQQQPSNPETESLPAPAEQQTPPANAPAETKSNPETQPSPTPETQTAPAQEPKSTQAAPARKKAPTRKSSASVARKPRPHSAVSKAPDGPSKVVVKNGGATEPTLKISPGLTQQQASSQRRSTTQLLAGTDANLKRISAAQLNANQQDMVKQIQQYTEEAKAAGDAGDLERQHNLALKANLLSAELVKH